MSLWENNIATDKIKLEWDQRRERWPLAQNDCSPLRSHVKRETHKCLRSHSDDEVRPWGDNIHRQIQGDCQKLERDEEEPQFQRSTAPRPSWLHSQSLQNSARMHFCSLELLSDGTWAAIVTENWQSEQSRGLNYQEYIWNSMFSTPFLPTPSTHSRTAE